MGSMTMPRRTLMGYFLSAARGRGSSNEKWLRVASAGLAVKGKTLAGRAPRPVDGTDTLSVLKMRGRWPARRYLQAMVERIWFSPKRH